MKKNLGQGGQTSLGKQAKCSILVIFICSLFFSCASNKVQPVGNLNPVYVTNTKAVNLLPPSTRTVPVDQIQLLNGRFGTQEFTLITYFQLDSNGIFITLLNDFGTDMGSASYDGNTVQFDSPVFPKNMKAEYIIADIQNAYYDFEELKANFEKSGLIFEEKIITSGDNGDRPHVTRLIKNNKKVIEEITISEKSIRIQNYLRGYEYNLTQAEVE